MSDTVNLQAEDLVLKGVLDGSRAFIGPEIVQFDITNRCNNNCLCCWNNSPLLGEPTDEKRKEGEFELPFDLIKKTIGELKEMGTKILFFAGGGEPFMHPEIMEILRYAKECNLRLIINSNFTLVDKERAREIVDAKVDFFHVSLLAGTPRTYAVIHPNKDRETFNKIKEVLRYIAFLKQEKEQNLPVPVPHINLYFVIFNKNYPEIKNMTDFAIDVKANSFEFTPVDVIPGKTDCLLLKDIHRKKVLKSVMAQYKRIEKYNQKQGCKVIFIEQYNSFLKRLSDEYANKGQYERKTVSSQPCYAGWAFLRILANGSVTPCLKAHRISLGNIHDQSIKDIWNSQNQQLFRAKSFKLDESDPYFKMIGNNPDSAFGCLNSCDNIQINIDMHNKYADILRQNGRIK